MERILYFILILLLTNCQDVSTSVSTKTGTGSLTPNYSKLQHLFQDTTVGTLYVYSDWSPENLKTFAFKGKSMDSIQASLLPVGIRDNWRWNKDFGACYKFPLDKSNMALIGRTSGEYVSSAIKLFIFNFDKDSIVNTINLADTWGDAGEASVYSSCIFKDKGNELLILTYYRASYDHRASDIENDTIVENWNYYYLYKLSNNIVDTLSKDSADIVRRYPNVVHKLASY